VYNRTVEKVHRFISSRAKDKNIYGAKTIEDLIQSLKKPRIILMMVKAGSPVDDLIETLLLHLKPHDILIDGGNSHFTDTIRRTAYLESKGLRYIGTGVSGGEEGALTGPSIMPGGSFFAWSVVKPILQSIAARNDEGAPCCEWIGDNGAGHFVKMVHNGIEYGDMQLIAEAYHLMKSGLCMDAKEMQKEFRSWNEGSLDSYLIGITADILEYKDENGGVLLDFILDLAGQKGTGKWTSVAALDEGIPLTLISEAVFARYMSALKEERSRASRILKGPISSPASESDVSVDEIHKALYAAKIISYAQGFQLLRAAASRYAWDLKYNVIARIWTAGCIIRSVFLSEIEQATRNDPGLENLMQAPFFRTQLEQNLQGLRSVIAYAVMKGIPVPALSSALAYYDSYRSEVLPANLIQAQRDYFGAHTYERIDRPRGEHFHTDWTGRGGTTSSTDYNA
jgi:6-phosphogluconate dehydrogenase